MHSRRVRGRDAEDGVTVPAGSRRLVPAGSRHAVRRIGYVVVALAVAVPLALSVRHEVQATGSVARPRGLGAATAAYRQEKCIYRAVRSELPRGATIFISEPAEYSTNAARVVELSTTWAVPQPAPATARWTATLIPEPGHCRGLALEVRRR